MEEDYELVPIGPIRRLEKKLEQMEQTQGGEGMKTMMEIVKSNQAVVDEMVRMNSDLADRVSKLMESVDALSEKLTDFIQRVELSGEEEAKAKPDERSKMDEKLTKLEKRLNALILTTMPNMKLKR
ncbi:MAG: hypothetical protein HY365_01525 [Candidatus Aenigmarchaeota archaeon]|nr:hypothetical protein [Candidatus Aenigmarchaeota archaeon]